MDNRLYTIFTGLPTQRLLSTSIQNGTIDNYKSRLTFSVTGSDIDNSKLFILKRLPTESYQFPIGTLDYILFSEDTTPFTYSRISVYGAISGMTTDGSIADLEALLQTPEWNPGGVL